MHRSTMTRASNRTSSIHAPSSSSLACRVSPSAAGKSTRPRPDASPEELQAAYEKLAEQEQRKRQARDEFDRALGDTAEKIRKLREQDDKLTRLVDERRGSLQNIQGKYASLEALQKAAKGEGR